MDIFKVFTDFNAFDMFVSHMYLTAFVLVGIGLIAAAVFFGDGKNKVVVFLIAILGGILAAFGVAKVQQAEDDKETSEQLAEIDEEMKKKDQALDKNKEEIEKVKKEKAELEKKIKQMEKEQETVHQDLQQSLNAAEAIKPVEVKPEEAHQFLKDRIEKQRKKGNKKA